MHAPPDPTPARPDARGRHTAPDALDLHRHAAIELELTRQAPFAQMDAANRQRFLAAAELLHFDDDAVVLEPAAGPVSHVYWVLRGGIHGERRLGAPGPFSIGPGDLFPLSAALAGRAVSGPYQARGPTDLLRVGADVVQALVAASPVFADYVNRRVLALVELSRRALQHHFANRAVDEQSLDVPLGQLVRGAPVAVPPDATLGAALQQMQAADVGSILVVDDEGRARGILTRHDLLDRVALARRSLDVPVASVMSAPVHTLDRARLAHDAALLMSTHGVRHVPVTEHGRVVGMVSERDLFALQRRSLGSLGRAIDSAPSAAALQVTAVEVRRFAEQLFAQGVQARPLTELLTHLNDRIVARAVALVAQQRRLDPSSACWLAFGSEGRGEQTLVTDQDNGLIVPAAERIAWRALGEEVNHLLAACGFPLCEGGIMAGQPDCCLTPDEWRERFAHWIGHGGPQDLLDASIFFDLRAVTGDAALAAPLRRFISEHAARAPRLLRLMAAHALSHRPPLAWHGGIAGDAVDLKLQGTAIFVEAARVLALAAGSEAIGTRARLQSSGAPEGDVAAWVAGFDYLQMLRLAQQMDGRRAAAAPAAHGSIATTATATAASGNRVAIDSLNEIDRRILRETLRAARRLQQRLELDLVARG